MIGGTMPVPAMYTARAGWETVARLGVERIRAKSLRQTRLLRELVEARGFTVNTPAGRRRARRARSASTSRGRTSSRASSSVAASSTTTGPRCGLRVSPHFYTTDDELHAFVDALDDVRQTPARGRRPRVILRRAFHEHAVSSASATTHLRGRRGRRARTPGAVVLRGGEPQRVWAASPFVLLLGYGVWLAHQGLLTHWFNSTFSVVAVTVLFVMAIVLIVYTSAVGGGELLRVHANGILDLRVGPRSVRWDEIESLTAVAQRGRARESCVTCCGPWTGRPSRSGPPSGESRISSTRSACGWPSTVCPTCARGSRRATSCASGRSRRARRGCRSGRASCTWDEVGDDRGRGGRDCRARLARRTARGGEAGGGAERVPPGRDGARPARAVAAGQRARPARRTTLEERFDGVLVVGARPRRDERSRARGRAAPSSSRWPRAAAPSCSATADGAPLRDVVPPCDGQLDARLRLGVTASTSPRRSASGASTACPASSSRLAAPWPTIPTSFGRIPHAVVTPMRACLNDRARPGVRDAQVARDGELRATADRGAGEGGDDGHGEARQSRRRPAARRRRVAPRRPPTWPSRSSRRSPPEANVSPAPVSTTARSACVRPRRRRAPRRAPRTSPSRARSSPPAATSVQTATSPRRSTARGPPATLTPRR